jgi:hypothetical protein
MSVKLQIAKELALPLDAVTQKLAWLGRTGSGKTYGAKRMVEQMLRAGAQVVIVDPVGVWAGLRLGPKSFDVPVLGGLFGDIPLESTAGALVADLVVNHATSMVIDVSQMLDAERTRFAQAFAARFYQRKKSEPGAVHLVLEECQEFVPQNQQHGEERMLHEFQRLAKLGRNFGIGLSLISQRPQEVNKKALNQAECVFAFQMTGPQERKALEYWLSDKGFDGKLSEILPRLEVGAPHVWSPQWLKISRVVHILAIDSLDTSQTPKVGDKAFKHRKLQPIDLKALSAEMTATIERAKAEDPKLLRARIAELERKLQDQPEAEPVRVPIIGEMELKAIHSLAEDVQRARLSCDSLLEWAKTLEGMAAGFTERGSARQPPRRPNPALEGAQKPTLREKPARSGSKSTLGKGETVLLTAIAQHGGGVTREQLTVLSGYKRSSRDTYLQRLKAAGLVEDNGDRLEATSPGVRELGPHFTTLPTGAALRKHWLSTLPQGERVILQVLVDRYPKVVAREHISEATGYQRSSRDTYLQRLRSRQLIAVSSAGVTASEALF